MGGDKIRTLAIFSRNKTRQNEIAVSFCLVLFKIYDPNSLITEVKRWFECRGSLFKE